MLKELVISRINDTRAILSIIFEATVLGTLSMIWFHATIEQVQAAGLIYGLVRFFLTYKYISYISQSLE